MDKGWALTLDSDSLGFFPNKPTVLNSFLNVNYNTSTKRNRDEANMFQSVEFPVSLNRREDQTGHMMQSDENREVDFFSDKTRLLSNDSDAKANGGTSTIHVKKENSHGDVNSNVNTGLRLLTANTGSDQSMVDDGISSVAEEKRSKIELAQLQVELERMNAENQRLRGMLHQVSTNYSALQMHIGTLMTQQQQNRAAAADESTQDHHHEIHLQGKPSEEIKKHEIMVPRQFLDLAPSATTETDDQLSHSTSDERTRSLSPQNNNNEIVPYDSDKTGGGRGIGREESPGSETQGWVPNKAPRLDSAKPVDNNQSAAEATMRKARVSVRARSEAPMITDGCQWRKYGQKMAKGNPCPRAYYRCTMNVGCPVRKQVQRCAEDRSILITTYEGSHNHPLPPAAMAMASTTSAAASMLLSGSMSSADGLMNSNFLARAILPCSSNVATISASAPFPTVTLDLTHSPNPLQFQRPPPAQFQLPFQGQPPQNFGSLPASSLPQVFGQALYNQSKFSGLQLSQEMDLGQLAHQAQQPFLADTVSAATAAITADPNFTAALAAAITSIINGGANSNNNNVATTTTTTSNSNGNITTQQQ